MPGSGTGETRVVAVVGPYQSGKTRLIEAIVTAAGALPDRGTGSARQIGDASAEARARHMGIDLNVASCRFMEEAYSFLDCPGAVEFAQEMQAVLPAADAALIVCEPDETRISALAPLFRLIENLGLPRIVVLNKIDRASGSIAGMAAALQAVSRAPVVLRQIPIRKDGAIAGYVDLAQGAAHHYHPGQASDIVEVPQVLRDRLASDRQAMLETLADFDDNLLEELLEGIDPPQTEIYADLSQDVQQGRIVPVFMAVADQGFGVRRLMKALRHELPPFALTAARLGVTGPGPAAAIVKSVHTAHGGKLSIARVLAGAVKEGDILNGDRVAGVYALTGVATEKAGPARAGDVVGLGKLDSSHTGDIVGTPGALKPWPWEKLAPVFQRTITLANKADDVKLSAALAKLCDEDPALHFDHDPETAELLLSGQGDVHLGVAIDRLASRFGLQVKTGRPQVPYRETIGKPVTQQTRFKRQSGGHGQFADATIQVAPRAPGEGYEFIDRIHGGAVPRHYIPSVDAGVQDGLKRGPLGFPVVDVSVTLIDGKFHSVDSSDMAFQTCGRIAIQEALPLAAPVLLEPICHVRIHVPSDATARANALVTARRGALLGFDARAGWSGWDTVEAHVPQAEIGDLIVELRSATQGTGTYDARFDHYAELFGKAADHVVQARKLALDGRRGG